MANGDKPAGRVADDRSELRFEDFKPAYSEAQAIAEANRCLYCHDAPCIQACPTEIDIPEFIRKIGTGNIKGSARTIFTSNIFGMSCARVCPVEVLCVGSCVFHEMGAPPIQIGKLQRYATDIAFDEGWRFAKAGPDTGRSVGLVGGGPASLAAAHELRRLGHACAIYERQQVLGGLNTYGVAPYKLQADRSLEEIEWVLGIGGIEVKTGIEVGVDVAWEALLERHDAVFVGVGLGSDRWLSMPGADLPGVMGALDFIERMKLERVDLAKVSSAVVIGGGNTAVDAVRELLVLGVPSVTMVYRRDEEAMSGYTHEWAAGRVEGAHAEWYALPVAFEGDDRLEQVRCVRLDENTRPIEGSEFPISAELALFAVGQRSFADVLGDVDGVVFEGSRLVVDEDGATGRPGLFAAGDAANAGKEVVNAVAEGKRSARAIDSYLETLGGTDG